MSLSFWYLSISYWLLFTVKYFVLTFLDRYIKAGARTSRENGSETSVLQQGTVIITTAKS